MVWYIVGWVLIGMVAGIYDTIQVKGEYRVSDISNTLIFGALGVVAAIMLLVDELRSKLEKYDDVVIYKTKEKS